MYILRNSHCTSTWAIFNHVLVALFLFAGTAAGAEFEAGIDYLVIDPAVVPESDPEEVIKVIEYFSYGCKHCYTFEDKIKPWLENKEDDVVFEREAVVFQQAWVELARAYYIARKLDIVDKVHMPIFHAVHKKKDDFDDEAVMQNLFEEEAGIEPELFKEVYSEDEVLNNITEIHALLRLYGIKRTPTIVVADRFIVNTQTARSQQNIFNVVDYLVNVVRDERTDEEQEPAVQN